jgi:hypothetical protein
LAPKFYGKTFSGNSLFIKFKYSDDDILDKVRFTNEDNKIYCIRMMDNLMSLYRVERETLIEKKESITFTTDIEILVSKINNSYSRHEKTLKDKTRFIVSDTNEIYM